MIHIQPRINFDLYDEHTDLFVVVRLGRLVIDVVLPEDFERGTVLWCGDEDGDPDGLLDVVFDVAEPEGGDRILSDLEEEALGVTIVQWQTDALLDLRRQFKMRVRTLLIGIRAHTCHTTTSIPSTLASLPEIFALLCVVEIVNFFPSKSRPPPSPPGPAVLASRWTCTSDRTSAVPVSHPRSWGGSLACTFRKRREQFALPKPVGEESLRWGS